MRSLDRYAIFIMLGCGLLWRPCLSSLPLPCCDIDKRDVSALSSVFQVTQIFLNDPKTCNYTNVAQFWYKDEGGNASKVVCANGFSLMSFLLNVLQRVLNKTPEMDSLAEQINRFRTDYSSAFSVYNSKTEKFNVISSHNGTLVAVTRMDERSTTRSRSRRSPTG
ncbi:envelope glycoprotein L [Equid gammaherpesvirus 2]|nr:envelope glycoprotein L [Equid gammaherpesvirus 2]UTM04826.1 envelope glycoprotein L [Equid gammaherpesvirus 2]